MFIAKSLTFYPDWNENYTELSDEIIIPSYHLNRFMENFEDNEMLYVNVTNTETNQSHLVAIGSPHNYDKNTIFIPQWICDIIGCSGSCDSVIIIEKATVTDIPPATKIVIKPLDPVAFEINTQECFEQAFMNLHSIIQGITIPIPVSQLGKDYHMFAHIEKVEPNNLSRIVHGEVDVEFINDFIVSEPVKEPVEEPVEESVEEPVKEPVKEISLEERRKRIREAWINKFSD